MSLIRCLMLLGYICLVKMVFNFTHALNLQSSLGSSTSWNCNSNNNQIQLAHILSTHFSRGMMPFGLVCIVIMVLNLIYSMYVDLCWGFAPL